MHVRVGTSGYSYKEWKGPFYPADLPAARFLSFYAGRLDTVEINNTFYRMPTAKLLQGWAEQVPETFVFALKAPQRITHIARLQDAEDPLKALLGAAGALGPRLGPLLFQLPPSLRKDVPRLAAFLALVRRLSATAKVAFELRHPSWFDEQTWAALRAHQAALCVAEGEALESPLVATADWGYVRLRRSAYPDSLIAQWADKVQAQPWREAYVYVKHDEGDAPAVATRLMREVDARDRA